jgi:hypothetical protein
MNNQSKAKGRRKFLLTAGLGGAGAAVAVVAGTKVARNGQATPEAGDSRGYRVSEHVLKYYKTTLV